MTCRILHALFWTMALSLSTACAENAAKTSSQSGRNICFAVVGDSQGPSTRLLAPKDITETVGGDIYRKILKQITATEATAVFHAGDMIWGCGAGGRSDEEYQAELDYYYSFIKDYPLPIYHAIGNHEAEGARDGTGLWNLTRKHLFMKPPANGSTWYRVELGGIVVYVLDQFTGSKPYSIPADPRQWQWLQESLAADEGRPIFTVFHAPLYSPIDRSYLGKLPRSMCDHPSVSGDRDKLAKLLVKHHVALAFAGHAHHYSRMTVNGLHQVISGGAGGFLSREAVAADESRLIHEGVTGYAQLPEHHFVLVRVDFDNAEVAVEAIGVDGKTLDSFRFPLVVVASNLTDSHRD